MDLTFGETVHYNIIHHMSEVYRNRIFAWFKSLFASTGFLKMNRNEGKS